METRKRALNGTNKGALPLLWAFKGDNHQEKKKRFGSAGEIAQWVRPFAAKSDEFHPRDTHGKKAAP